MRIDILNSSLSLLIITPLLLFLAGYSTGDPSKREGGAIVSLLGLLGLIGTSTFTVYQFLSETNFQL
jgi:hypothetical protein